MTSAEAQILEANITHVARTVDSLARLLENVPETLAEIRATQSGIQITLQDGKTTMSDHEQRIKEIELAMPGLKEMRKWVVTGIIAGVGMLGVALLKLVVIDVPRIPNQPPVQVLQQHNNR